MEEVIGQIANFDFELSLGRSSYSPTTLNKMNSALEFIFFWMGSEKEKLLTLKKYDDEYFKFVKDCRGFCPSVTNENSVMPQCWWGKVDSKEDWLRERVINSNLTALEMRDELGLNVLNTVLCNSRDELDTEIKKKNSYVVKDEFGFSGKGIHFDDYRKNKFPVIVEDSVQRVRDFGIRINKESHYIVQNLIDKKGSYKGSLIKNHFREEDLILESSKKIFKAYESRFGINEIQIDSFQYLKEGELHFNPLCEVNHRKSMSGLSWELHQEFGNNVSVTLMISKKKLKSLENFSALKESLGKFSFNRQLKKGIIPLSPVDVPFSLFYMTEVSERSLQHLIKDFWKEFALEGERLPSEFVVYF